MKAIIISDEQKTIDDLDSFLSERNFGTIIYRWLLKALDNIEEIRPDLIIVSANEYPRHWKTLTQFVASGIGGDSASVVLLSAIPLSSEESDKASALGVKGFFCGTSEEGLQQLSEILEKLYPPSVPSVSVFETSKQEETEDEALPTVDSIVNEHEVTFDLESSTLIFLNPKTGKMITGNVISYSFKKQSVDFVPEDFNSVKELHENDILEPVTFEIDGHAKNYKGSLISKTETLSIFLEEELNG